MQTQTPPPYPYSRYDRRMAGTSFNGLAVARLVLGIVSSFLGWLCLIPYILAVVFGHVALNQIPNRGQQGRGLAIGGLATGYTFLGLYGSLPSGSRKIKI